MFQDLYLDNQQLMNMYKWKMHHYIRQCHLAMLICIYILYDNHFVYIIKSLMFILKKKTCAVPKLFQLSKM